MPRVQLCRASLVIDRLGAGWLGPYGNTWLETPNFNRLAAQSVLCETVVADSPDLVTAYRAYWTGRHAIAARCRRPRRSLPAAGRGRGRASHPRHRRSARRRASAGRCDFGERRAACQSLRTRRVAAKIEANGSVSPLRRRGDRGVRGAASPTLLWIHARGMSGPWDAPLELRNQFADEDDPAAAELRRAAGAHARRRIRSR